MVCERLLSRDPEAAEARDDRGYRVLMDRHEWEVYSRSWYRRVLRPEVKVSPEAVREYYESHPDSFRLPERCRVRALFITKVPGDPVATERERARSERLREAVLAGADFSELARKHSELAAARDRGGEMGWMAPGAKGSQGWEFLRELEIGGTSDIVETGRGFWLAQVLDRRPPEHTSLEEAEEDIRESLVGIRLNEMFAESLEELKGSVSIERRFDLLAFPEPEPARTLAVVDGTEVPVGRFESFLATHWEYQPYRDMAPAEREAAAEDFIGFWLMARKVRELGLDREPYEARLLEFWGRRLLGRAVWDRKTAPPPVGAEEVARYYESHREDLLTLPEVRARILELGGAQNPAEAIETVMRLKAARESVLDGRPFEDLVRERVDGPKVRGAGLVEWTQPGPMGRFFDSCAFSLEPGEVSLPQPTGDGCMLIHLLGRRDPAPMSLDQARDRIRAELEWLKRKEIEASVYERTLESSGLQIDEEVLAAPLPDVAP